MHKNRKTWTHHFRNYKTELFWPKIIFSWMFQILAKSIIVAYMFMVECCSILFPWKPHIQWCRSLSAKIPLNNICVSTLSSIHWYWLEELWLVATKDFPTIATKYFRIISCAISWGYKKIYPDTQLSRTFEKKKSPFYPTTCDIITRHIL